MKPGAPKQPDPRAVVLNVDDNEGARYAKGRMLHEGGFDVVDASNGPEALEQVARRKPDLVLLDVGLPLIDGIEVCRRLKSSRETALIPVVQVSASFVDSADRARGLEGGADAYLTSPFDARVLIATVTALLRARRAEIALRASEDRFRTLADAAPVLIWISDAVGRRSWCNRSWLEFTGRNLADEIAGWIDGVHPDDRDACLEARGRAFDARAAFHSEYRLRRADGTYRWVLDEGRPLYDASDQFAGFIGSCVDITERRAVEDERRRVYARERAAREESERLNRVKDEFLATLSHELRTPLNAILGWTAVLRTTRMDPRETASAIERIERSARAQARIIEDLLDVSRIISGKVRLSVRATSTTEIVESAIEAVRSAADAKGVRIETHLDRSLPAIAGDPDRLQQVVWNLLTNALKFSPRGERIDVATRAAEGAVEIVVTDFGEGIAAEFMPHVFERFRQADSSPSRSYGGLGLGLSIVKSLVEMHGGTVRAHSDGRGKGATFVVRLPLSQDGELQGAADAGPGTGGITDAADTSLAGLAALIVDDDVESRTVLERMLELAGARAVAAASAPEALERLNECSFDVLLSDIAMPDVDGYELIRRVRASGAQCSRMPAIALTAFARDEDRQRTREAGFQAHVAKPIDRQELIARILALTSDRRAQSH